MPPSYRTSAAQTAFEQERTAVLALLDLAADHSATVVRAYADAVTAAQVFARLLTLSDKEVRRVLAFVMAETLAAGSAYVEAAGAAIQPKPEGWWEADDVFFDLIRDRRAVNAMLAEVAGEAGEKGNITETAKVQKKIIRDCLTGTGREKVEGWVPRYLTFPIRGYREDASFDLLDRWNEIEAAFAS